MSYEFSLPGRTIIGENALKDSESILKKLGKKSIHCNWKNCN